MIIKKASAGTLESCDALVTITLNPEYESPKIDIESPLLATYGREMQSQVEKILEQFNIQQIQIKIIDRGAINYVLQARVETAIRRVLE